MGMRGSSIVLKFLLTIYMARYLALSDVGLYGLIAAAAMMFVNLAGFGFQFFTNREIARHLGDDKFPSIISNQFFFNISIYLIAVPAFIALYTLDAIPANYLLFFATIAILEHFSEELYAMTVNIGRPVMANILFFTKSAAWVIPIIILGVLYEEYRSLEYIFIGWSLGLLASLAIAISFLWRNIPINKISIKLFDWGWIKGGIKTGIVFYVSLILSMAALYADRFIISSFLSLEMVGVYMIFWSFCNAAFQLIKNGVVVFYRPKLIQHANKSSFAAIYQDCMKSSVITTALLCLAIGFIFPFIEPLFNKELLSQYNSLLYLLLASVFLRSISYVQILDFYSHHRDKLMLRLDAKYFAIIIISQLIFVQFYGLMGIGLAAIIATIVRIILNQKNLNRSA